MIDSVNNTQVLLKKLSTVKTRFPRNTKKNANADAEADKPNGNDIVRLCLSKRNSDCEKENDVEGRS